VVRTLCGTDFKYINANLVIKKIEQFILTITNVPVSETIRKPPLVKPKLHFKKTKNKIPGMAKNDFQYGGLNY